MGGKVKHTKVKWRVGENTKIGWLLQPKIQKNKTYWVSTPCDHERHAADVLTNKLTRSLACSALDVELACETLGEDRYFFEKRHELVSTC